jgi:hypothetical protein
MHDPRIDLLLSSGLTENYSTSRHEQLAFRLFLFEIPCCRYLLRRKTIEDEEIETSNADLPSDLAFKNKYNLIPPKNIIE